MVRTLLKWIVHLLWSYIDAIARATGEFITTLIFCGIFFLGIFLVFGLFSLLIAITADAPLMRLLLLAVVMGYCLWRYFANAEDTPPDKVLRGRTHVEIHQHAVHIHPTETPDEPERPAAPPPTTNGHSDLPGPHARRPRRF